MYDSLLKEARNHLAPTHYLCLRILEEKARICASHSAGMEQAIAFGMIPRHFRSPVGTVAELRAGAAVAGLKFVSRAECVAVECTGCETDCGCAHPPVYECATEMFFAYQDLKHVPKCSWPPYAKNMLTRYIPLMYTQFGAADSDVEDIEGAVVAHFYAKIRIPEMSNLHIKDPSTHDEKTQKESNSRNKKKNMQSNKKRKGKRRK